MNLPILFIMLRTLDELRSHEKWTRARLEAYRQAALLRLRKHAYAHSPFYQLFHSGLEEHPLQELPVLTKTQMMNNFDDLVTDRSIRLSDVRAYAARQDVRLLFKGRYWVNATSGSSGQPGIFLFDQKEWATVLASFARSHEWAGIKIGLTHRMKMASVASTSMTHMSALVGETLRSWWMPALRLAASQPLAEIVQKLNDWQPDMLVAYASMARILAGEQHAGRLMIHPHLVYTSSEVLTDDARRQIKSAWGHEPFNQYASTEVGGLAAETTQHQGMLLYEDNFILEVVDDHYRPVPAGEYGSKVLLTSLYNFTQPLIRYELNDSLKLSVPLDPSHPPFACVEDIQGRTEDILNLPGFSGVVIPVHPLVFHRIMDTVQVNGWQIVQESDRLKVLISGEKENFSAENLVSEIHQELKTLTIKAPPVIVERVTEIPRTAAGKTPLIKALK